jgi:hypothetical protein
MKKILQFNFLAVLLIIVSCSKDGVENNVIKPEETTVSSYSLKINNVDWKSTNIKDSQLIKRKESKEKLMQFTGEDAKYLVSVVIFAPYADDDVIPAINYLWDDENSTTDAFIQVSYKDDKNNTFAFHNPKLCKINVTSINPISKTISGTLSGTLEASPTTTLNGVPLPEVIEITNGEFKNIPYTVFNF